MGERRYAVIIGINDYDNNPLSYCVDDAVAIKNLLEKKANFKEDDIHIILSASGNSTKDITGKIFEALSIIKNSFREGKDSIFFYFAGHGCSEESLSYLVFHDAKYAIVDLLGVFSVLKPKMQFYVIDACASGSKALTRSVGGLTDSHEIDKLIAASSGALFLYACQSNEYAFEESVVKHGVMTHYFLEAADEKTLYDSDGVLTPSRIQEYVAKKVSQHSVYAQIPVTENRMTGYYPFICNIFETGLNDQKTYPESAIEPNMPSISNSRDLSFTKPNRESRLMLQEISIDFLEKSIESFISTGFDDYTRSYFDNCDSLDLHGAKDLKEQIVLEAEGRLKSINKIIVMGKEPIYNSGGSQLNPMLAMLGNMGSLKPTGYKDVPRIDFASDYYDSFDVVMRSSDIWKISFGIGAITYQAKWGGVISVYYYKVDWDGEENNLLTDIRKYNLTYLVEERSVAAIPMIDLKLFEDVKKSLDLWNKQRAEELEVFKIK